MLYGVDVVRDHIATMYFIEAETEPDIMQILEVFQPDVWYVSILVNPENEENRA